MTRLQRGILVGGIILAVLLCLFPPWTAMQPTVHFFGGPNAPGSYS